MKKFSLALIVMIMFVSCACADNAKIGYLTRLNTDEDTFKTIINDSSSVVQWQILSNNHSNYDVVFFDTLREMIMAVISGKADEIVTPNMTAEHILEHNHELEVCCSVRTRSVFNLAMGFRKEDQLLRDKFNEALKSLEDDWTLAELQGEYIYNSTRKRAPVKFEKFKDAPTIKIAVTGGMPPVDYVSPSGQPEGFNVALLAEVSRRAGVNIELIDIDSGARTAALTSGRVDAVFWYETSKGGWNADANENIILSMPYYSWNTFLHLRKK